MHLLADENVHGKVVACLRTAGLQIEWVKETTPGTEDDQLLARPDIGDAVLITNDSDFGDLIFNHGVPAPLAVLYTRTEHRDWRHTADLLLAELERGIVAGQMTTITKDGVRRRSFPSGAENG